MFTLMERKSPELFRDQFPYSEVPKILFNEKVINPSPPRKIWITDTTFRDGQQARPPDAPQQIIDIYSMLHRLGGPKGIIRQCEFFLYSQRDRKAAPTAPSLRSNFMERFLLRLTSESVRLARTRTD